MAYKTMVKKGREPPEKLSSSRGNNRAISKTLLLLLTLSMPDQKSKCIEIFQN